MKIEALKEEARRHEQKEQWKKALGLYMQAIERMPPDEPDIGLYNRAGDLNTRVGNDDEAVECYDRAIDLYIEAELPNNAIAICKKVIRNFPTRARAFLRMGQVRASQGYIADARTNYVTYAEKIQAEGDTDEALRALIEFARKAEDDHEIRMLVGAQLEQLDRTEEAVEQLISAHQILTTKGMTEEASGVESKIRELDPGATIPSPDAFAGAGADIDDGGSEMAGFGMDFGSDFGAVELPDTGSAEEEETAAAATAFDGGEQEETEELVIETTSVGHESADFGTDEMELEVTGSGFEEEAEELPMMEFGGGEVEEEAEELPMMEFGGEEVEEEAEELPMMELEVTGSGFQEEAEEPPTMEFGGEEVEEEVEELPMMGLGGEAAEEETVAVGGADFGIDDLPGASDAMEAAVEEVVETAEEPVEVMDEEPAAETPPAETPAEGAAAGGGEGFVDLGSMILDAGTKEKTTRFVVEYEEPSGDEEADFARMLAQFKEKVSENVDSDDVESHYDLGTAYKEMGLLDEAISQYQQALKASDKHLPTYEMLGQTFIEKGEHHAAVTSLSRALDADHEIEDEMIGIYYYLGLAHEALGNTGDAIGFFDKVFALDINFADVTDRLRALRG